MPIRINLLAEVQAAEDLRRRDPVKRTLLAAILVVAVVLVWCLAVQTRIIGANSDLKKQVAHWTAIEKSHSEVADNLKKAADIGRKLAALNRLSTNRFLMGSTLNALQQTVVDQVQAVRVKTDQVFTYVEPVPAKTNSSKTIPGKPASAIEKVAIIVEAKDWNPADQNYNKFKDAFERGARNAEGGIFRVPSNETHVSTVRLTSLSKPSFEPADPARSFVTFTLEMQLPEIQRHE